MPPFPASPDAARWCSGHITGVQILAQEPVLTIEVPTRPVLRARLLPRLRSMFDLVPQTRYRGKQVIGRFIQCESSLARVTATQATKYLPVLIMLQFVDSSGYLHTVEEELGYPEDVTTPAPLDFEDLPLSHHARQRLQERNIVIDDSRRPLIAAAIRDALLTHKSRISVVVDQSYVLVVGLPNGCVITALPYDEEYVRTGQQTRPQYMYFI